MQQDLSYSIIGKEIHWRSAKKYLLIQFKIQLGHGNASGQDPFEPLLQSCSISEERCGHFKSILGKW